MRRERLIQIIRLQENLSSIRKIAGWTANDLGEMLDVSKQNISNLENAKIKMSVAQYVAIRHFLDYYIIHNSKNETLPLVINLLLDHTEIEGKEYNNLKCTVHDISVAASLMSEEALKSFAVALLKSNFEKISGEMILDNSIKKAMESFEKRDWTADIIKNIL